MGAALARNVLKSVTGICAVSNQVYMVVVVTTFSEPPKGKQYHGSPSMHDSDGVPVAIVWVLDSLVCPLPCSRLMKGGCCSAMFLGSRPEAATLWGCGGGA